MHDAPEEPISDRELAVLQDPELLASIRQGIDDAAAGRVGPLDMDKLRAAAPLAD